MGEYDPVKNDREKGQPVPITRSPGKLKPGSRVKTTNTKPKGLRKGGRKR